MAKQKLVVRARGTALVTDYHKMDSGVRAYVSRRVDHTKVDEEANIGMAFVPTDEDHVLETHLTEYRRHVQHGDLWAADEATAKACGVKFDPTFGAGAKVTDSGDIEPQGDADK